MRRLPVRLLLLLPALCCPEAAPAGRLAAQAPPLEGLDAFIQEGMREWGIPGLAVGIVRGGETVLARGYGVRRLGEAAAVDEHTLFGAASLTKAFTAAALGILVDEGRIGWDDAVADLLPGFVLHDAYATRHATVRDLLAHRVGVGRLTGNRLRWLPSRPRSELLGRLRHLPLEAGFRERHVYSNVLYMAAGEIVPAVAGRSWEDFTRERILLPLGMERSSVVFGGIRDAKNAAWPHQEIEGEVVAIPRRDFDAVGPAASLNTSVAEMLAWMRLHLGVPGEVEGAALLRPGTVREMHSAQCVLPDAGPDQPVASYGLGWRVSAYEGRRISSHTGAVDGMNSILVLLHEEQAGVVVFTNVFNDFMHAVVHRALDRLLGIEDRPWDRRFRRRHLARRRRAEAAREALHAARRPETPPSRPLAAYAGRYEDAALYADARVAVSGEGLVLAFWDDPGMVADLEHWHHDTFRAVWRNRSMREEFVRFTMGFDGAVDALHVQWVLRPDLLQVGAYPSGYTREAVLRRTAGAAGGTEEPGGGR